MRKIVTEDQNNVLEALLGEQVMVWSMNYIYAGTVVAFDDTMLVLDPASVVYETGPFNGQLKDAQKLPHPAIVMVSAIEMITKL